MLYLFILVMVIVGISVNVVSRKQIDRCTSENERKQVKAKWQLISGLIGIACFILAVIVAYTMLF